MKRMSRALKEVENLKVAVKMQERKSGGRKTTPIIELSGCEDAVCDSGKADGGGLEGRAQLPCGHQAAVSENT